jgi:capsular exopolysaccharide synthesis family protein
LEPVDYLRALRQRWLLIVALTLFGIAAAFLTSSSDPAPSYQATHILIVDGSAADTVSLARAAFLVTSGDVPNRVAETLGEDPREVLRGVSASTDVELNGLRITGTASTPEQAVAIADTFASELVGSLDEGAKASKDKQIATQQALIASLQAQLAAAPFSPQAASIQQQISTAQDDLAQLQIDVPDTGGIRTLQAATASPVSASTSRTARLAIGAIMGFLLGVVAALVLARFDTRIRAKELVEKSFGAPVLAEIPQLKRSMRSRQTIVAVADPESLASEGYRGLRTALMVASRANTPVQAPVDEGPRRGTRTRKPPAVPDAPKTHVVLVASPGMGEGKTTTSANLAVAFAETGRRVLLLGCDLRRPELHSYFGLSEGPGLTDELAKPEGQRSLTNIIRDTKVPGVQIATSGEPIEHPGELLTRGLDLIRSARNHADVVVIDTAPLLATDDASVLLPLADVVVLVCRSGRTSVEAATRARELLDRLHAPLAGVAFIGARQLASARSYYRVDYRARTRSKKAPAVETAPEVAATPSPNGASAHSDGPQPDVAPDLPNAAPGPADSASGNAPTDASG